MNPPTALPLDIGSIQGPTQHPHVPPQDQVVMLCETPLLSGLASPPARFLNQLDQLPEEGESRKLFLPTENIEEEAHIKEQLDGLGQEAVIALGLAATRLDNSLYQLQILPDVLVPGDVDGV